MLFASLSCARQSRSCRETSFFSSLIAVPPGKWWCKLARMQPVKIVSVILGLLFALAGVASVASGGFLFGASREYIPPSGFLVTSSQTVGSNGFALTAPNMNGQIVGPWANWANWGLAHGETTVRVTGSSKLPTPTPTSIFIGVAATPVVSQYLSGVTRDRIRSIDLSAGSVSYVHVDGKKLPAAPDSQRFWVAKVSGTGSQTLEWKLQQGDWTVVIMNGDASAPVVADMTLGVRFGIVTPLLIGLIALGVVLLAVGATLIVLGSRRRRRRGSHPTARQNAGQYDSQAISQQAYRGDQPR